MLEKKISKTLIKIIIFILVLFYFLNIIQATTNNNSNFYADLNLQVFGDGSISFINPDTNYIPFENITKSQKFTSKDKEYWILNISSKVKFKNYIYELTLPEYSQINYIKTTPHVRFENNQNKIKIIGTGEDKPLTIIIQYKINKPLNIIDNINLNNQNNNNNNNDIPINYIAIFILFITTLILIIKLNK